MIEIMCAAIQLINLSGEPWNPHDKKIEQVTSQRCYKKYKMDAPCLKTFIKRKPKTYRAICGKEREL